MNYDDAPTPAEISAASTGQALAIISLVFGIISLPATLVCCPLGGIFPAIPTIICGHVALVYAKKVRDPGGTPAMAWSGLIMGYLVVAAHVFLAILIGVMIAAGLLDQDRDSFERIFLHESGSAQVMPSPQLPTPPRVC